MRSQFLDFVDYAHPRMIQLLLMRGVSRPDAEDAAQEAVLQAWNEVLAGRWAAIGNHERWLRKVLWHVHLRPPGRKRIQPLIADSVEPPDRPTPGPGHAELTEQTLTVLNALAGLPDLQRAVLALTLDGATDTEIAELLGESAQRVRDLRKQGRAALRRTLAPDTASKEEVR